MGKMYTIDGKLLTETPELRIGEKIYPVDDRTGTVKKVMALTGERGDAPGANDIDIMGKVIELGLGPKAAKELKAEDMPFPAYQALFESVVMAMTGGEPESGRFRSDK